ncbi:MULTISPECIES: ABC transporter substrate-binding protein [Photorhabdus]|uniref:ABC transporter substrate-binding protein n=1 Tax=Photorhabdus TaxID=29487 RepID=UPI000DCDEAC0|nr:MULTISPECIES: ABC transporter substrate-binding protein [Photorhabdus]MCT8344179.1 ABC transporter substrate-binding protein [Photorhabdus kleinii]RAW95603.1 hypothetical protein CKY03_17335 [Photorhabdus sp. S9-53]RAW96021.1 hypothetical protein CKY05_16575 [Photorhabdus sp. S10-54]RAX00014.1 hypothetical protein CKY04_17100 [Photorhabdus sp. S8-52]
MNSKLICGISAILDPKRSIHALTVIRAIEIFKDLHNNSTLEFIFSEDYGSIEGGAKAAHYNIENNVDMVIGHFSSNAAIGAAEVYSHHNIPVMLPTATETTLTIKNSNIFRLCFNNKNIAHALAALIKEDENRYYEIKTDGSKYSNNLAENILRMLGRNDTEIKSNDNIDQVIFIGTIDKSEKFLHSYFSEKRDGKIILTDDAACKQLHLPENVENGQITGIGFAPVEFINPLESCIQRYIQQYDQFPNIFFLETFAALEIAHQLATSDNLLHRLQRETFQTTLGHIKFIKGECSAAKLCLWTNENSTMKPRYILPINSRA